ncbi:MAG: hypothetical protein BZY82_04060 [SAR202 cluster bacterium Io17-Chloro-G3]|nr:MAG: hypothetical protein BZY82_04060 [SAR202 cluster bacterium Io17-Chloro-G3]
MVQFGIQIEPQFGFDYNTIRELAFQCEASGFDSIWLSDHLFLDSNSQDRNCLDCWTTLAALAAETTTIRLGPLVSCVSYRHPSIMAKIAATVDVISNGRLEFGIGAGWKELEYKAYGIPFPAARDRVSQLIEAIQVIQAMWTQDLPTFEGHYYQITNAFLAPKPIQKPYPPLWVGGTGSRVLQTAARFADGININGFQTPAQYRERLDILERHCKAVGREFSSIKLSHFIPIVTAENATGLDRLVEIEARRTGTTPTEYREKTQAFVGTPEDCVNYIKAYTALGVSRFMLLFPYRYEADSIRLLSEQVLPYV